jgi:DNA-binding transcriptional MerR regulator
MAPTLAPSGATLAALGDGQMIAGMTSASVMTIGRLSRRTGVPVKVLREYEDMGLIYTVGRSAGNYRLFDEDALWCVGVVSGLRTLGLTLNEIQELASNYLAHPGGPVGQRLGCSRLSGPALSAGSPSCRSCWAALMSSKWLSLPNSQARSTFALRTLVSSMTALTLPPGGDRSLQSR